MQGYVESYGLCTNSDKDKVIKYTNKDFSFISCTCCLLVFLPFMILGFVLCIILPPVDVKNSMEYSSLKIAIIVFIFGIDICWFFCEIIWDSIQFYLTNKKQIGCKLNTKTLFTCLKCFEDSCCYFLFSKEYTLMTWDEYVLNNVQFCYHDTLIKSSWLSYFFLINVYNYKKYKYSREQKRLKKDSKNKEIKRFKERCKEQSKETYEEMLKELQKLQSKEI